MVRCFQLDIRKKIIKIFKILEKHPIPRDRWHIYLNKYFFTKNRSLEKNFIIKKLLKNLLFSNCDLQSITNWDSWKQQNLSNLSPKEKNTWLVPLKKAFSRKVDTHLKLSYQPEKFFEKVLLLNCDLWFFPNWHSQKQKNLNNLSPKDENISLLLLKISFYVR